MGGGPCLQVPDLGIVFEGLRGQCGDRCQRGCRDGAGVLRSHSNKSADSASGAHPPAQRIPRQPAYSEDARSYDRRTGAFQAYRQAIVGALPVRRGRNVMNHLRPGAQVAVGGGKWAAPWMVAVNMKARMLHASYVRSFERICADGSQ